MWKRFAQRAAQKIEEGAVTETYQGDVEQTISILNEALATEIVCVLRYMHHYFMATGVHGMAVRDEFKEHADAEREHADKIAERIQQLGGKPDFNPASLFQRSASQYVEGKIAVGHDQGRPDRRAHRHRGLSEDDPPLRRPRSHDARHDRAHSDDEEEHASDLSDLLFIADPRTGETEGEDPGTHPLDMHARREVAPAARQSAPNKGCPDRQTSGRRRGTNKSSKRTNKGNRRNSAA